MNASKTYGIDISFEELKLPLFHDVLVLAKNAVQGKLGLGRSLDLLAPGVFQSIDTEVESERIEAVFINRKLLTKIPVEHLMRVLQRHVFEYVGEGELIQVDMKVRISMHNINE
ncbi:hypothetical protein [Parapedobacter indicus]|uniref:Uncharacterized protein n=1 Tax=Parapedobacter indicus TaxID=1477437 RepID=A0A1I3GS93_9SPHI|nr:hypothetical protein [Parapedobacter indicus]PPL02763.1 hypothetical protein CLV26_10389 [Parapedobacter indicus]SFI26307.1 hypothetical protein SAMN05444682_10388 [Parapedobacter indicus]